MVLAVTLWVITGVTGEYSDRTEWVVGYCTNERAARSIVTYYTALSKEIEARLNLPDGAPGKLDRYEYIKGGKSEYEKAAEAHPDPHYECDYTGTRYHFNKCERIKDEPFQESH